MPPLEAKQKTLNALSQALLLIPTLTVPIARLFRPILLELVARALHHGSATHGASVSMEQLETIASALSKLLHLAPHISNLVLRYFSRAPSLFERIRELRQAESDVDVHLHQPRRVLLVAVDLMRVLLIPQGSLTELARTAYRFLRFSPSDFGTVLWDWSPFFSLISINKGDTTLQYYVMESVSILLNLSDHNKIKLPNSLDTTNIRLACELR